MCYDMPARHTRIPNINRGLINRGLIPILSCSIQVVNVKGL